MFQCFIFYFFREGSTNKPKEDKQSNLSCVRAKYENIKKHFSKEVYFTMKDKNLKRDSDQSLKKYQNLLSLNSFDAQILENKEAYELIQSNIYRLIEKHKLEKKDLDLNQKQLTKENELINEFMFFDVLEIEDFNFIRNYLNNQSFYEARELKDYFKDFDMVKIHLLNHAKKNNLKVVIYNRKSDLQANNHTDTVRNSIDQKIKALEEFGIYK